MNIGVKLSRLNREDFIWIIYLFIALAALISDSYERDFLLRKNLESQKKFKIINITILSIAFFIYLYFLLINYDNMKHLKREASKKEVITSHLALIASLLFLVGGIITLIVEIQKEEPIEDIGLP